MSPDILPHLFEAQKKLAIVCVRRFRGGHAPINARVAFAGRFNAKPPHHPNQVDLEAAAEFRKRLANWNGVD